jgi:hypothetical protein
MTNAATRVIYGVFMGFIQILNSTAGPPLRVAPRQARPSLNRDPVFMGCMELEWVNSENKAGMPANWELQFRHRYQNDSPFHPVHQQICDQCSNEEVMASIWFSMSRRFSGVMDRYRSGLWINSSTNSTSSGPMPHNSIKSSIDVAYFLSRCIFTSFT